MHVTIMFHILYIITDELPFTNTFLAFPKIRQYCICLQNIGKLLAKQLGVGKLTICAVTNLGILYSLL